jgi:hypothetical protein
MVSFIITFRHFLASTNCEPYEYFNCDDGSATECSLVGEYFPRQWKNTLDEAKEYCAQHSDCRGITLDNGGYEPRRGPEVEIHVAAHELWLCTGIHWP